MECAYVKIPCAGHEQPPTREQAQLFIDICSKFVAKNPLQCIGMFFYVFNLNYNECYFLKIKNKL